MVTLSPKTIRPLPEETRAFLTSATLLRLANSPAASVNVIVPLLVRLLFVVAAPSVILRPAAFDVKTSVPLFSTLNLPAVKLSVTVSVPPTVAVPPLLTCSKV